MNGKQSARSWKRALVLGIALLGLGLAAPAQALFHLAHISEVMASYNDDDSVQFVEIEMAFASQNFIRNAVIAVFDADGNYLSDWIVFDSNVTSGAGATFLTGTASFESALVTWATSASRRVRESHLSCRHGDLRRPLRLRSPRHAACLQR